MTQKGEHAASIKVHVSVDTRQRLIDLANREERSVNFILRRMIHAELGRRKA